MKSPLDTLREVLQNSLDTIPFDKNFDFLSEHSKSVVLQSLKSTLEFIDSTILPQEALYIRLVEVRAEYSVLSRLYMDNKDSNFSKELERLINNLLDEKLDIEKTLKS